MEKNIIGKKIKLIWEDKNKALIKVGIVRNITPEFITIKTERKLEMIPIKRIVRIEMEGE